MRELLILPIFLMSFLTFAFTVIATDISGCTNITTSGSYVLTSDITFTGSNTCINITAQDVTLDCENHIMIGTGVGDGHKGINLGNKTTYVPNMNVLIKDCQITNFDFDIYSDNVSGITFYNINMSKAVTSRINIKNGINFEFKNITMKGIGTGSATCYSFDNSSNIYMENISVVKCGDSVKALAPDLNSNNITILKGIFEYNRGGTGRAISTVGTVSGNTLTILNSTFSHNTNDIFLLHGGNNSLIDNCIFINTSTYSTYFQSSSDNITIRGSYFASPYSTAFFFSDMNSYETFNIYNNFFNTSQTFVFTTNVPNITLNTSKQIGVRPFGKTIGWIGGNYWGNLTRNGYSDTCIDFQADGFCDDGNYTNATNGLADYLPYSSPPDYPLPVGKICSQFDTIDYTTPYQYAQELYNISETNDLAGITFNSLFTIGPASGTLFRVRVYEGGIGTSGTLLQSKIFSFADVIINQTQWKDIILSEYRKWDISKKYWVVWDTIQHTTGDKWQICTSLEDSYPNGGSYASINGGSTWIWNGPQDHQLYINISDNAIKNVNLSVTPPTGNYSQQYNFFINITEGLPPYYIEVFVDGFRIMYGNIYTNYYQTSGGGFGIGTHTAQVIVKDFIHSNNKSSNIVTFITTGTGMIAPVTLTVTPQTATPFTNISFHTSSIYNGSAVYTVEIKALEVGGHIIATCTNLQENWNCNGTFLGSEFFNSGNIPIVAVIRDSAGNVAQSTTTTVNYNKGTEGDPLIINFAVNPMKNKTTDDLYTILLNFTGSKPPYKVEFRDTNGLICTYENTYTTKYNLNLYFYSGGHRLNAIVYGSDAQMNISNFGSVDKLYFDISQAGNIFRLKNRVINCGGILGIGPTDSNNEVYTGVDAPEYGGNYTEPLGEAEKPTNIIGFANSFVSIITSPMTIWTLLLLIIGFGVEAMAKWNFGGKAVAIIFIVGATLLSIRGIYPTWFLVIEGVIIALIVAVMVRKGQGN